MSGIWPYIVALIPSAGVAFLFYVVIKNMLEGDRKERLAHSQWEAEQDRRANDAGPGVNGVNDQGRRNGSGPVGGDLPDAE